MSNSRLDRIKTLLAESPEDSFLHFALAKEHEKEANHEQAILEFEYIFHKDPSYIGNYYHLGKCYEALGESEKALQAYVNGIIKGKAIGDLHAVSELQNAKMNLELEL